MSKKILISLLLSFGLFMIIGVTTSFAQSIVGIVDARNF